MIKLEYVLEGNSGELELQGLSNYESKNDILSSIETSDIEFTIIEDALKILKPDLDTAPLMYACERGGERNVISPKSEANRLGLSKLIAKIDDSKIVICC
jgi:hypothetical protein